MVNLKSVPVRPNYSKITEKEMGKSFLSVIMASVCALEYEEKMKWRTLWFIFVWSLSPKSSHSIDSKGGISIQKAMDNRYLSWPWYWICIGHRIWYTRCYYLLNCTLLVILVKTKRHSYWGSKYRIVQKVELLTLEWYYMSFLFDTFACIAELVFIWIWCHIQLLGHSRNYHCHRYVDDTLLNNV